MTYPSRIIGWPRFIHPGWKIMLDAGRWPRTYEPESVALFEAMTPEPNPIQKQAIDQLMKDAWLPVWSKMDGIYIRHSFAEQPSLLNWKNPSEVTTPVNSPQFFPFSGWQGDRVAARLRNPTALSAYTLNDCHFMSSQVTDVGGISANPRLGDAAGTADRRLNYYPRNPNNERPIFSNGTPQPTVASVDPTLLTVINRTSATGFDIYDNGVFTESALQASISNPQLPLHELAMPNANQFGNMRINIFTFGGALTPTEIASINSAWLAYKAAMGA